MFCEKCGAQIRDDSKFCEVCGARIPDKAIVNSAEYNELQNELEETKARNSDSIAEENKAKEEASQLGITDGDKEVSVPIDDLVKSDGNPVFLHKKRKPFLIVACIALSGLAIAFGIILALKKAGSNTNEKPSVPIEEDKDTEIINETDDNSNEWNLEIIDTRGSSSNNQWLDYPDGPTYLLEFGDTLYVDLELSGNGVSENETEITVEVIGKEWKDNNFIDTVDTFTLDKLQKNGSTDTFEYSMLSVSRFTGMSMKAIFYDDSGNELNHLNIQYGYPDGNSSKYIVTAEPNIRLRNEPSVDSDVIGKLFYGEIISVYKIINGWAIVGGYGAPEEIAWASAEYLTPYDEKNSVDLSMDYAVDYYDIIGMKLKDVTKNLGTGFYKNPPGPAGNMPSLYYRRPNSEICIYYYNPSIGLFPEWGSEEASKAYDITNESVVVSYVISTRGIKIFDEVSIGDNGNGLINELDKYNIGYELITDDDFYMSNFIVFNVDNKSLARACCNRDTMEIKSVEVYDNQKSDFVWVE